MKTAQELWLERLNEAQEKSEALFEVLKDVDSAATEARIKANIVGAAWRAACDEYDKILKEHAQLRTGSAAADGAPDAAPASQSDRAAITQP